MSNFDPHNVEAELSYEIESPRLRLEHGGETTDRLLNDYFDPEKGILKADCIPNEAGISSMKEAIQEARKGYTVAIKIHHRRAGMLAKAPAF
ncbi:hypothetical protein GGP91_002793 [Salinibacter ruber]|uniref:hypothetical protein n=1 Tax=Salinibacter ruber TaxID=146919 RepID=UPI002166D347|nr:hypothetical protein [Salinibacter ruber]MCS3830700.1 hypothetical protein [Salinibacter ruber]MCS4057175.1 hypothetical protein [Salinibacter ruber]MCS4162549.1 hypothetical protein [Salinibacter ruber]